MGSISLALSLMGYQRWTSDHDPRAFMQQKRIGVGYGVELRTCLSYLFAADSMHISNAPSLLIGLQRLQLFLHYRLFNHASIPIH